jgi:hypothetical protein
MYTIKLLAAALRIEPSTIFKTGNSQSADLPVRSIKISLNAGIIFSVNAFLAVYCVMEPGLASFILIPSIVVHAVAGVLFSRGFYLLGKHSQNRIMEISSLLFMVLFPITNALFLLRLYFPVQEDLSSISFASNIFTILCVNDIFGGIGLFIQASKTNGSRRVNLFKLAGILVIIPSILYLGPNAIIVFIGLFVSLAANIIMTYLLYTEVGGADKPRIESIPAIS